MSVVPDGEDAEGPAADRRPVAARDSGFARRLTAVLLKTAITPNQISLASVAFAALGAVALFWAVRWPVLYLAVLAAVQLRLLCNLLDGMVAVEGGRGSPVGALYNEFPDRVADTLLIVALGYAAGAGWLGWAGALAAALTAYVRVFGGSLGQAQDFRGPMAKQHRMALMSLACVLALGEAFLMTEHFVLYTTAWIILAGSLLTCFARTRAIVSRIRGETKP
ncbi:CDP-alcohol phosphatidyltransferase family protein [Sinorhizobium medicae]|uniref:CDP-alcohol phosphatidyltransferase n=2 Tax=Sinorhizobium medicae TaxID=110321 RepID=A6U5P2_SINMW|nr:CDP-alcohol phosphatidyltransferase family protein [Sinorhizobium medicae]ABR58972.1 CDP-alcohol phosphatidyltransferase [Sinorhizobium medicae WSM419]MBO1963843.1 CDP-alcohol phosphatidyltransferase family protein [Sinorhizobium medicae]MDX0407133.1 CDP-alcohol phosphatidyltransferase family protein [Sinorhizobium medicae]MDX0412678.1 CDP-alcohol phosphatidyltransferase family protein [Sinorhizobium medicae]MDX0419206.1 CDP-alcohol phosphatidyltransferase family protein [Sinorhizobium medi